MSVGLDGTITKGRLPALGQVCRHPDSLFSLFSPSVSGCPLLLLWISRSVSKSHQNNHHHKIILLLVHQRTPFIVVAYLRSSIRRDFLSLRRLSRSRWACRKYFAIPSRHMFAALWQIGCLPGANIIVFPVPRATYQHLLTVSVAVCTRSLEKAALKEQLPRLSALQLHLDLLSEESAPSEILKPSVGLVREMRIRSPVVAQPICFLKPGLEPVSAYDEIMVLRTNLVPPEEEDGVP